MSDSKAMKFLEQHQSQTPSSFEDEARWRQENEIWLRMSRSVALSLIDYMQENNLSRATLAKELGITTNEQARKIAEAACVPGETVHNLAGDVTPEEMYAAIIAADKLGEARLANK